jgi:hypothetical protein
MRALDHPRVLADDLPLGRDHEPGGVDPQADRAVGERGRHAIAVPFEADQTGRRHPLALLDEAVKGRRCRHQGRLLQGPDLRDGPRQRAMCALPQLDAALLEPGIQCRQVRKVRHQVQDQVAGMPHTFFSTCPCASGLEPSPVVARTSGAPTGNRHTGAVPAGRRIAELRLEDIVAGHRQEPGIDLTRLAGAHPVHRGLRVHCPRTNGGSMDAIVDAPARHAAEDAECVPVSIEQHLVGLRAG